MRTRFFFSSLLLSVLDTRNLSNQTVIDDFDYCFAENGLTAYKLGKQLESASFIKHVGEDNYKEMVKVILHYIADLDIPVKRWAYLYAT